ncbi:MAG: hypothetical protein IPJ41_05955 [Phycisphaerales bacterium]|nr:hypothetical protein [Phycisphaerales bacterium]
MNAINECNSGPASVAVAIGPGAQSVLFPVAYTWLVLAGALDVIMTYLMLSIGAIEVNVVADHAIRAGGLWGLIALKFGVLAGVLGICEFVGRRRLSTARQLVSAGVFLNFLPVVLSIAQLALFFDDWVETFLRG